MHDLLKTNYDWFVETIASLANSQGCYSRMYNSYLSMDDKQKELVKEQLNSLNIKFNAPVDVILWLEG